MTTLELHEAAADGDLAKARELLRRNPDLALCKDPEGSTPLHVAVVNGHKDVVHLLLANKADVSARVNDGATPLHLAAHQGHKEVAELLVASQGGVNTKANNGFTPLHQATWFGHKGVAQLLVSSGAEINPTDIMARHRSALLSPTATRQFPNCCASTVHSKRTGHTTVGE